jgi:hypothetical protein
MIAVAKQCAAPITGTSGASENRMGNDVCAINVPRVRGSDPEKHTAPEELMSVFATRPFIIVRAAALAASPPRQMRAAAARSAPGQR